MTGFRATVKVSDPMACPVADVSATTEAPITGVSRSRATTDGVVVEEFNVATDAEVGGRTNGTELTPVRTDEQESVYRFDRPADAECACELVERTGTPISSISSRDGTLQLTFHTTELGEIADVVDELRAKYDEVAVVDLSQDAKRASTDPVVVDRDRLTSRQREILETAHEMGYFDYPKGANATDVAAELDIARSTFTEHLSAAQTKLLDAVLEK